MPPENSQSESSRAIVPGDLSPTLPNQSEREHDSPQFVGSRAGADFTSSFEEISNQLSSVGRRVDAVGDRLQELQSASSTPMLDQILAVTRQTLTTVSTPTESGTDQMKPLIRDLVSLVFNCDDLLSKVDDLRLKAFRLQVIDIVSRYGAEWYQPEINSKFVSAEARAVESVKTDNASEDGLVHSVVRVGWVLLGERLFYPQVRVKRWVSE